MTNTAERAEPSGGSSICVFCASSPGKSPSHREAAASVGRALASSSRGLVYGGGNTGHMGEVSRGVLEGGSKVHGITLAVFVKKPKPEVLNTPAETDHGAKVESKEGRGENRLKGTETEKLTMYTAKNLNERMRMMASQATGGFIILPGGFGTLLETIEMVTWVQYEYQSLPIIVLNVEGFFDPLKAMLDNMEKEEYIRPPAQDILTFIESDGPDFDWGAAAIKSIDHWHEKNESYTFREDQYTQTTSY